MGEVPAKLEIDNLQKDKLDFQSNVDLLEAELQMFKDLRAEEIEDAKEEPSITPGIACGQPTLKSWTSNFLGRSWSHHWHGGLHASSKKNLRRLWSRVLKMVMMMWVVKRRAL